MKQFSDLDALKKADNNERITSKDWFVVTQEMVNSFAEATKDYQWIHVDPERAAKESPFGGPIAHGFFSLSLLPKFIEDMISVESVKMGVNYGVNKVRFPHHVPVGSSLRCHLRIAEVESYQETGVKVTWECTIEIKGVKKPACVAEMLSLMFE
jgi:acyl dehydratase